MSRTAFLPAGSALAQWLRDGPASDRAPRAMLWTYRWKGYWFDRNWQRQRALYPPTEFAGDGGHKLVFVMGFWRSGTTLLHELLAAAPGMAAPRTWQCMNPSGFRIAGAPTGHTALRRPMDAVIVSALSPQEDEFALLARGAPSVYRAWLDPRRWEEQLSALEQNTWLALPPSAWLDDWRSFLGWCMPETAARLVVKSPNHVFRLRALHRAWPQARFVWMLRDPVDTWHSNRKMWRAMATMYGLWQAGGEYPDRLIFAALSRYAATLRWAAEALPGEQSGYLDFERVTAAPAQALAQLALRLGLRAWESKGTGARPENYAGAAALPDYGAGLIGEIRDLHRRLVAEPQPA